LARGSRPIDLTEHRREVPVKPLAVLATALSFGCALAPGTTQPSPMSIWVRSHNRSAVDVYLLCGARNARWLGVVSGKGTEAFEILAGEPYCISGLNFFLVVQRSGRGYWVGPFRPAGRAHVDLVIEKYAGLSQAQVRRGGP
jgi:hypothetical protein